MGLDGAEVIGIEVATDSEGLTNTPGAFSGTPAKFATGAF
jgi:hypothetical protein